MRVALSSTLLIVALCLPGCSGGSGDDVDGGGGNGDGNSGSAGVVAVESVSPDHGPLAGGTLVTITGQGFLLSNAQPNSVLIGGVQCPGIQLIDDRTMKVEVPPGTEDGPADVIVFNSNGYDTLAGAYSYNPLPTISAVTADNGSAAGGETVTIIGTGFQNLEPGTNLVFFGENEASDVTVASDTSMTVTTPPGEAFALVDVAVVNDNGAGEKPQGYEYNPAGETIIALGRPGGGSSCGCGVAAKPAYFGTPYADTTEPLAAATLFSVDPETGAVASLATSEEWINGLARAPDGTIYGVISRRSPNEDLRTNLVTVDLATGDVTPVGPLLIGGSSDYASCDITFVSSVLFGVAWQAGSSGIHTINTLTGATVAIGGTNLNSSGNGLVFDGAKLYNSNYNGLCEIDSSTGTAGNCKPGASRMRALTMANGKMYGAVPDYWDPYASNLVEVDRDTGATSAVTKIPGKVTALTTIP